MILLSLEIPLLNEFENDIFSFFTGSRLPAGVGKIIPQVIFGMGGVGKIIPQVIFGGGRGGGLGTPRIAFGRGRRNVYGFTSATRGPMGRENTPIGSARRGSSGFHQAVEREELAWDKLKVYRWKVQCFRIKE
ncbi:hypothetical protein Patl1_21216 [Pistacia atlantica]|uniref:Uncharacterized protein n=1 Tax=Pistacia atlantica TaxID=434234 RepID=A0ACC1BK65_9ROSI|nr:hypothetical protein Patl1_21216 [Pistacia atlantica]